jgi:hypothetical protein
MVCPRNDAKEEIAMSSFSKALSVPGLTLAVPFMLSQPDQTARAQQRGGSNPPAGNPPPSSIPMGGNKSVTRFFVASKGLGKGGDLGGLAGADAHCQALAQAQGAGDHTWRAYLSTEATATSRAVNARDRIGAGPWYNSSGDLIAPHLAALHGSQSKLTKDTAVTENADEVKPEAHEILTGSRPDGTAFPGNAQRTCNNWTSSTVGNAEVGYSDHEGKGDNSNSWNSAHPTSGCSEEAFRKSGGTGLFYCFAVD